MLTQALVVPEILSINQGEPSAQASEFMKKRGYDFHVLLDPDSAIGALYAVRGIPTVVVVDKAGVVQFIQVGYSPSDLPLQKVVERFVNK